MYLFDLDVFIFEMSDKLCRRRRTRCSSRYLCMILWKRTTLGGEVRLLEKQLIIVYDYLLVSLIIDGIHIVQL